MKFIGSATNSPRIFPCKCNCNRLIQLEFGNDETLHPHICFYQSSSSSFPFDWLMFLFIHYKSINANWPASSFSRTNHYCHEMYHMKSIRFFYSSQLLNTCWINKWKWKSNKFSPCFLGSWEVYDKIVVFYMYGLVSW